MLIIYPIVVIPYYVITRDFETFFNAFFIAVVTMIGKAIFLANKAKDFVPKELMVYPNHPT